MPIRAGKSDLATHLVLLLVTLSWGFNNISMKIGFTYVDPIQFGGLRMLIVLPFMVFLAFFIPGRIPFERRDLIRVSLLGVVGMGLFQILFPIGIDETSASLGGVLMATMPVQVVILALVFKTEKPGWRTIGGVLLTVCGLVVITAATGSSDDGTSTVKGILFVVFAETGYAVHSTFLKPYMHRYSPLQVTGLAMSVSFVLYLLVFSRTLLAITVASIPLEGWLAIIYSGMVALFIANVAWNVSIRHLGSTRVSVYGNLPTVFVLVLSALLFHDLLAPVQIMGALVILSGLVLVQTRKRTPNVQIKQ